MLNLKKLEEKLDEALNRETEESLTKWLLSKRVKSTPVFFVDGEAECVLLEELKIEIQMPKMLEQFAEVEAVGEYNYAMAA